MQTLCLDGVRAVEPLCRKGLITRAMTSLETRHPAGLSVMIAATGVVSGDIAASPLYAFREGFIGAHALPLDRFHVLGVLS